VSEIENNTEPKLIVSFGMPNSRLKHQLGRGPEDEKLYSACVNRWRQLKYHELKQGTIIVRFASKNLAEEVSTYDWSGSDHKEFEYALQEAISALLARHMLEVISKKGVSENIAA